MTGCTLHQKSSLGKTEVIQKVDNIMDDVYVFALKSEAYAQKHGRKLTVNELRYAKSIGLRHPEKIRILLTSDFPVPMNKEVLNSFK